MRLAVTGASQGIGRSIALLAAARGAKVLAVARSADLLDALAAEVRAAGGTLVPVVADICDAAGRDAVHAAALAHFGGLDVLVNNAGVGATGHLIESKPETLRYIFETNYFATVELTRRLVPLLAAGENPAVVMVSSVLGKRAWPARSLYSASKFALQAFGDALRAELAPRGVRVLVVSPGLTQTNFSHNMLERSARIPLDHLRGMTSDAVAAATLDALAAGDSDVVLTPRGKLLVAASKYAPWLFDLVGKRKIRRLFAEEIAGRRP